jgi:hypothetical protein
MRWIIRDVGIFLYGCVFASKYIFFRQVAYRPKERDAKRSLIETGAHLSAYGNFP